MGKVKVVTMETIKPSSPTPSHLSTYKLSLLDNFPSPQYIPLILFFDSNINRSSKSESEYHSILKKSLSDVLTRFYPLAGRIKGNNSYIDCNDFGVDYFEAKVNGTILDFKSPDLLNQLLPPSDSISFDLASQVPLVIQVNMFDCGGLAISVCMSHKVSDASSMSTFMDGWAATARGSNEIVTPTFEAPSLFPLRKLSFFVSNTAAGNVVDTTANKLVSKIFVFDASKISALRSSIANSSTAGPDSKYPTRVEAVSALIWKTMMKRADCSDLEAPLSILNHVMDLRKRMEPPLPQESFGNILWMAKAVVPTKNSHSLDELVGHIRVGVSKINGDYTKKLQSDDDKVIQAMIDDTCFAKEAGQVRANMYGMSSWCKFPFYECDFGWGKPVWVTCSPNDALKKNRAMLMDTKCGKGIEAWVKLESKDMALFEHNEDLLEFCSPL